VALHGASLTWRQESSRERGWVFSRIGVDVRVRSWTNCTSILRASQFVLGILIFPNDCMLDLSYSLKEEIIFIIVVTTFLSSVSPTFSGMHRRTDSAGPPCTPTFYLTDVSA
jgi:hypothetical protein